MRKKTFAFSEIAQYREYLEIRNLKGKNHIVSAVFFAMMVLTLVYMLLTKYTAGQIIPVMLGYILLLMVGFVFSAYGDEDYTYLKISKYILTLGMFSIATALILVFRSPSVIPLLFIAYSVCAIYQDVKVMIISNIYFLFSIVFIIINNPDLVLLQNDTTNRVFSIILFTILFLIMLTISAYIIMKEKSFFYNQIAKSKEVEYRDIDLLMKLKQKTINKETDNSIHYERAHAFLEAFSKKLDIPNVFEDKINAIQMLDKGESEKTVMDKYPDFDEQDIERFKRLKLSSSEQLRKIAIKISKTKNIDIKQREIFSATHFKSFNKPQDPIEIRVIAFVVFYVSLKKGLLGMNKISDEDIFKTITDSDYYYYIDSRVMRVYQENAEVFDAIIADAFQKGGE